MTQMNVSKPVGRWSSVLAVAAMGLLFAGCHSGQGADPVASGGGFAAVPGYGSTTSGSGGAGAARPAAPGDANPDMLHAGEAVTITFTDLPETIQPINDQIKSDGTITLLQNQTFTAAGKTRGEFEKEIRNRYVPSIYKNMTVSVKKTDNTQFYYVGGEVKLPNRQVYLSQLTVLKAIQSAGDFTDFANKKKVRLTRPDGTSAIVNCVKARENPKLDLPVYPGDTIFVPRRKF